MFHCSIRNAWKLTKTESINEFFWNNLPQQVKSSAFNITSHHYGLTIVHKLTYYFTWISHTILTFSHKVDRYNISRPNWNVSRTWIFLKWPVISFLENYFFGEIGCVFGRYNLPTEITLPRFPYLLLKDLLALSTHQQLQNHQDSGQGLLRTWD